LIKSQRLVRTFLYRLLGALDELNFAVMSKSFNYAEKIAG